MSVCMECGGRKGPPLSVWVEQRCRCGEPRHNANPDTEMARVIKGIKTTLACIERDVSRLKTSVAELESQP